MSKQLTDVRDINFSNGEKTYGLRIIRKEYTNDSGKRDVFWQYGLPDGIQVMGMTEDGQVIAISEWQPGTEKPYVHLVGGTVEKGEDPFDAAMREFLEETGYRVGNLELLSAILENSGKSDRLIWCFLARDCMKVEDGEGEIETRLFKPMHLWKDLMDYFMRNPTEKHGAGNSLKTMVLAYAKLGLHNCMERSDP